MSEPVVRAIVPCTYAMQDKQNKWSLMGIYDQITAPVLPAQSQPLFLYVRLSDPPRRVIGSIQFEDPDGMVIWSSGPQTCEIPSSGIDFESVVPIPPCALHTYGKYRAVFYVGKDRVAETVLSVVKGGQLVPT